MYMKILVNWFLLGDQEAGPTDQAAWPDPWQGAAHTEEGLQLQVFIKFKDLVETKSTPLCAATWRKSAPRQLGARRDRLGGCQTSLSRKPSCLLQVWAVHEDVNIKVQKVIACKWKCWWQWYLSSYTSGKMQNAWRWCLFNINCAHDLINPVVVETTMTHLVNANT